MKFLILILTFFYSAALWADDLSRDLATPQSPPLRTDDPGTPGLHNFEINITFDGELNPNQQSYDLPLIDVNYGLTNTIQLKVESPFDLAVNSGGATYYSFGTSQVGVKFNFFNDDDQKVSVAVYPQLSFIDAGSLLVTQGFISASPVYTFPLLIKKSADGLTYVFNFGFNKVQTPTPQQKDFLTSSLGVGVVLGKDWSLLTEVAAENLPDQGATAALTNVGTMHAFDSKHIFYFSVGHELGFDFSGQQPLFLLTGLRFLM